MSTQPKQLFSKKVFVNRVTYYFDIREAKDGRPYMAITMPRKNMNGEMANDRIFVFADQLHAFHAAFDEAVHAMTELLPPRK